MSAARVIVGRQDELRAVDRFLDRLADAPAAVVFEGGPGIGKSTVWEQVSERAASRSYTVLSCRPVEAETKLAFASLADLLEPVATALLPALPEPQRLALDVALMRASAPGTPPSARAVATAVLSAIGRLAAASPVVLAIDDQQWLDRASAEAIAFALRRIADHRVGVAAAVRVEHDETVDPLALDRAFADRVERVRLGPLTLDALHRVIQAHLAHVFPRPTLRRLAEASNGNPFFALELARALLETGATPRPGEPLPVPGTLASLVARRLDRLPGRTRDALLVASALPAPTIPLVCQAVGPDGEAGLARGERAHVIEIREGRIRFTHPLLASAVYRSASTEKRRALHRRLAEQVVEPEERARHLGFAASAPDEAVARALDAAATIARRRGAPDTAAELQEQAVRLTAAGDRTARYHRTIRAAEYLVQAGDRVRARAVLEDVVAGPIAGEARARALRLLGQIRWQEDSLGDAVSCFEEALAHAVDPASRVAIKIDLSSAIYNAGDVPRAMSMEHEVLRDAERLGDPGLLADALSVVVVAKLITGRGTDRASLERARALEDRDRPGQLWLRPTALAGVITALDGRLAEGCRLLHEIRDWATERGEEGGLAYVLCNLSWVECWRGRFAAAAAWAEQGALLAEQTNSATMRALAVVHRGRARAASGDVTGGRKDFADGRRLLGETGYVQGLPWLISGEIALELSLGDAAAAARASEPLVAIVETVEFAALFLDVAPDAVEALVLAGEVARAESLLQRLTDRAVALDRRWELASAARCRSLLASARGDLDGALEAAQRALAGWETLEMPVELGRTLLTLGQVRRRRGERRLAREALDRSLAVLRNVGASRWVERADAELRRVPIRRARGPDLTPTEERVAALAGAGRTNAEVAQALFMSPKTVEANLARIYGKLGIRSRAELGARMVERAARPARN